MSMHLYLFIYSYITLLLTESLLACLLLCWKRQFATEGVLLGCLLPVQPDWLSGKWTATLLKENQGGILDAWCSSALPLWCLFLYKFKAITAGIVCSAIQGERRAVGALFAASTKSASQSCVWSINDAPLIQFCWWGFYLSRQLRGEDQGIFSANAGAPGFRPHILPSEEPA